MDIKKLLEDFWNHVKEKNISLYNEFSLQHELGIYLRKKLPSLYRVEFERNIGHFFPDSNTIKKEMDIVVYNNNENYAAIELKYPRNGQYPEEMFSFITDIQFMEEVKKLGFNKAFVMTVVDDKNFYSGKTKTGIYSYFRTSKTINGTICKPTGKKDTKRYINGSYNINWEKTKYENTYYYLIEV